MTFTIVNGLAKAPPRPPPSRATPHPEPLLSLSTHTLPWAFPVELPQGGLGAQDPGWWAQARAKAEAIKAHAMEAAAHAQVPSTGHHRACITVCGLSRC
jgi:hypothetical protein